MDGGQTHPCVVPLGTSSRNFLRNQKWSNHFHKPFPLNVFIIIIFFSHIYPLHDLIYGLKFILELKNENC
jgi:hypothetical protein